MSMTCPACKTLTLKPYRDNSVSLEIDSCTSCSGLWFDAHELATFLKSDAMKKHFLYVESQPFEDVGFVINTSPRRCPRDRAVMEEKIFGGITLDCCPKCKGLWFDEGEVRQVVERYQRGSGGDAEIGKEIKEGLSRSKPGEAGQGPLHGLMDFLRNLTGHR